MLHSHMPSVVFYPCLCALHSHMPSVVLYPCLCALYSLSAVPEHAADLIGISNWLPQPLLQGPARRDPFYTPLPQLRKTNSMFTRTPQPALCLHLQSASQPLLNSDILRILALSLLLPRPHALVGVPILSSHQTH